MPQGNTSARTVEQFVDGHSTELPNQSLLALRAKASILFEKSAQLADKWNFSTFRIAFSLALYAVRTQTEISGLQVALSSKLNSWL